LRTTGPSDAAADVVDTAKVGGGIRLLDHPLRVRRTNRAKTKMKGKERMAVILLQAVPKSSHQLYQLMNGQGRGIIAMNR
jgi:hypothetical protein